MKRFISLSKTVFIVLFLLAAISAQPEETVSPTEPVRDQGKMTLAALGDCILNQRVSVLKDPGFLKLVNLIREADCTWGNCESSIVDVRNAYPEFHTDVPLYAEPWIVEEFKWLGIDLVGCANNHAMDYGYTGLFSTIETLERAGIGYAGIGKNLEYASRPRYINISGGRIGQVNSASSIHPGTFASPSHPYMNGRPGLNPLRTSDICEVDKQTFDTLKKIEKDTYKFFEEEPRGLEKPKENEVVLAELKFVPAEKFNYITNINESDLKRITEAIKIARRNSRIVIASNHEHRGMKNSTLPAKFIETFAHACIDAGADVFIGTGPHRIWGIEIYKNKPIFYSLGNTFFNASSIDSHAEKYSEFGLNPNTIDPSEVEEKILKEYFKDDFYWQSFIPIITFGKNNEITDILIHPITLGKDQPHYKKGIPELAGEKDAKIILETLQKLSEPFKTKILFSDGTGIIKLE